MENIKIRTATLEDIESVAKLHVDSWHETYAGIISQNYLDNMKNNLPKRIERMKENHAYDIEEMEEDIKTIGEEIEKLRSKRGASAEEVAQESYLSLVFDGEVLEEAAEPEIVEEGLKDKIAQIKDKNVARKIAKKEAQIEKLRARIEKNGEGNEDNEELREDIEIIKGEIEKLKEKIKKDGGEVTQESYAILENLDVLEEGLKEKVAAKMSGIKDKRVAKKIAKKEAQIEKIKARLEKEKAEIEKSQDVLSREALQRRVVDYQNKVAKLQRDLTERAQSIEMSYQKALAEVQEKHLDPVIEGIIAKKNLSLVIDGRMARTGANVANLDITDEVVKALDKKVSKVKMETPKGF
mgnify:CR=1 FL=1